MKLPYAGRGDKFWATISLIRLTPDLLIPLNYEKLSEHGIGLTDLAKRASGVDAKLSSDDFDLPRFRAELTEIRPRVLAFNGKKAASVFYEKPTKKLQYGRQAQPVGETVVWILPSTSGSASGYWSETPWRELARFLKN
jgi:double-stranded uracil-DNA glycosylase